MKQSFPYYSLTEVTNEFMLATFNDSRKYFINYLSHAKWVWKELFWNSFWTIKHKYIDLDCTTTPYSFPIPADMVRFVNISIVDDCNKLRSLAFDENMNVLPAPTNTKLCKICGEADEISPCFSDLSVVQNQITIDDEVYIEKIWTKLNQDGSVVEIRQVPTKSYNSANPEDGYEIAYVTSEKHICKLEVKSCGCVKSSPENKELVTQHCGCMFNSCNVKMCDSTFAKKYMKDGAIKIQDGRIWVKNTSDKKVILSYQTNGECDDSEIMIPEFAVNAMIFGIDDRSKALSPSISNPDKNQARMRYRKAVDELDEFMNPIIMAEFMNVQMALPLWGYSGCQTNMRKYDVNDCCINEAFGISKV